MAVPLQTNDSDKNDAAFDSLLDRLGIMSPVKFGCNNN
jgi:hypothetical protein